MSRPRSIPKYRLHQASGQAVVDFNGRSFYLGVYGSPSSRSEYERLVAQYLNSGRSVLFGKTGTQQPLAAIFLAYLEHAERYYGKGRNSKYHQFELLVSRLKDTYGTMLADEFGPKDFKAIRNGLVERGLARSYINQSMSRLKQIFKWATSEELVSPTVFQALQTVDGLRRGKSAARETDPVKPVAPAHVEKIAEHLTEVVNDMIQLQLVSGARPGEICNLRIADIDRSGDAWKAKLTEHKNAYKGKERTIYFGPKAQEILERYLDAQQEYVFSPVQSEAQRRAKAHAARKTRMSCGNRPGSSRLRCPARPPRDRYDTDSYRRAIFRACDKAGIPKWSPNQLRHLRATEIRAKYGIEAASVMLGHSKADVTQIYAERDEKKALQIALENG